MPRKTSLGLTDGPIESLIGTAYDNVKIVADNLDDVLLASEAPALTSADVVLTHADVVLTNADAAATAADLVLTDADQQATALDAIATAADRVVTTQDAIDTAADAALTAADRVQTGLDAVATAADRVQTGLDLVATNQDTIDTAADLVQTNLDQIATAADRVQTGLDAAATAADLVQTNLDQISASADASTATSQASAASGSASAASGSAAAALVSENNAAASALAIAGAAHAMTKADFFAQMEQNKDLYAGSGFVEWGKHYSVSSTYVAVNQGLWSETIVPDTLWAGPTSGGAVSIDAISRTLAARVNVNGTSLHVGGVSSANANQTRFKFPPAPTATQLVTNGTFDTDTSGWTAPAGWSWVGGTAQDTSATSALGQTITMVVGQVYVIEATFTNVASGTPIVKISGATVATVPADSVVRVEFTATSTSHLLEVIGSAATFNVDNISVISKADLSRQDLCFLESWHENVSDLDWVVPYGSVQSGLTTFDGITLTNTTGAPAAGYSAFGAWETSPVKGYGIVYSTMTDANKQKFIADPLNNLYLDDNGNLVQVRYRVRTVKGLGDDWLNVDPLFQSGVVTTSALSYDGVSDLYVRPQGSASTLLYDIGSGDGESNPVFFGTNTTAGQTATTVTGAFHAFDTGAFSPFDEAVDGLCFALPIALVQRRTLAAYHPVFAPWGCGVFSDGNPWYSTTDTVSSTLDCLP